MVTNWKVRPACRSCLLFVSLVSFYGFYQGKSPTMVLFPNLSPALGEYLCHFCPTTQIQATDWFYADHDWLENPPWNIEDVFFPLKNGWLSQLVMLYSFSGGLGTLYWSTHFDCWFLFHRRQVTTLLTQLFRLESQVWRAWALKRRSFYFGGDDPF